jgi:hypothetical protein
VPNGEFMVEPGRGIGPVDLGMSRETVVAILGAPEPGSGSLHYYGALAVEYDEEGRVRFLEVSKLPNAVARLFGNDVFRVSAKELIERLKSRGRAIEADGGGSCKFPSLSLAFWRSCIADEEDIADCDEPWEIQGWSFMTVAVAIDGYWDR